MTAWNPPLAGRLKHRLLAIAWDVARRLRDPEQIASFACTTIPRQWIPHSLAQGHSGLALVSAHLDIVAPREGWREIGREYLARAEAEAEACVDRCAPGLFGGLTSVAMAAWFLAPGRATRRRAQLEIEERLKQVVPAWARRVSATETGLAAADFDLMSGLAGVGTYFLLRSRGSRGRSMTEIVLRALVALILSDPPGWRTPVASMVGDDSMRRGFPNGILDCGLAHGLPGLLALLAVALASGVEVPDQRRAVAKAAAWLVSARSDDEWGPNWPPGVPLPGPVEVVPPVAARTAWCYGAPGVSRSLWLAGVALGDDTLRQLAIQSLRAALRRPEPIQRLASPTFCHGLAGLLQIVLRFAVETGDPEISRAATTLGERVACAHEPGAPLGYRTVEWEGSVVDKPALLDGAPGVLLVLLAASTDVEPTWDRAFLLS